MASIEETVVFLAIMAVIAVMILVRQAKANAYLSERYLGSNGPRTIWENYIGLSHFELLHLNPDDYSANLSLRMAIEKQLNNRLMGPKIVELQLATDAVILRRSRLQYESHIKLYVDTERHGFEVKIPTHGFHIGISCLRIVPEDALGAPWDDLLEILCKIDRSIIISRNSKSQPLAFVRTHGEHPSLQVEVLSRKANQGLPELPFL